MPSSWSRPSALSRGEVLSATIALRAHHRTYAAPPGYVTRFGELDEPEVFFSRQQSHSYERAKIGRGAPKVSIAFPATYSTKYILRRPCSFGKIPHLLLKNSVSAAHAPETFDQQIDLTPQKKFVGWQATFTAYYQSKLPHLTDWLPEPRERGNANESADVRAHGRMFVGIPGLLCSGSNGAGKLNREFCCHELYLQLAIRRHAQCR